VSRVVERRFALGRPEKEQFVRFMRLYEEFCGVRVLAFCVMSNHFHILLEVPARPKEGIPDRELFRRLALLYSEAEVAEIREAMRRAKREGTQAEVEALREKYLYRMWDLSQFMKALKQRFTQWFNTRHERCGTLWESRFKSVIVEDGYAARVVAAYIDLNPIRAGLVEKPEDYRWCSYAEALAGKAPARVGIERVMSEFEEFGGGRREAKSWRQVIAEYRVILFTDGEERLRENENEGTGEVEVARKGASQATAEVVREKGGALSRVEMLRHRIRHFVDGTAIGTREFLEEVFRAAPERFGPRRKSGALKIRGCDTPLRALRDLQRTEKRSVITN
jgi:REP element-mobilizing transposase RayT